MSSSLTSIFVLVCSKRYHLCRVLVLPAADLGPLPTVSANAMAVAGRWDELAAGGVLAATNCPARRLHPADDVMQRSENRILTTHTGSLPRPPALTQLYLCRLRGEPFDPQAIVMEGRSALRAAVAKQVETGIDVINDGEQTRESFVLYLRHRLTGLGGTSIRPMSADIDAYPSFARDMKAQAAGRQAVSNRDRLPKAVGAVAHAGPSLVERDCAAFRAALDPLAGRFVEPFLTAPSPGILATIVQNEHYDTFDNYLAALGAVVKVEYDAIVRAGFLLQLDCPDLALERHTWFRGRPLRDFLDFVERVVATINSAIADIPRGQVRLHVCWGNYEAPHDRDVPLREILPIIRNAAVGGIVLPFANPRHAHEYRVLETIPLADDQVIVAGVIDTLTNFVEHPEVVADRIERLARAVGDPRRVLAGTDCGFDTSAGMGRVSEDVVWAKLAAMTEGARIASRRLFGGR
jgi:5-methyltetrahydropteroyltriglutamate--homocysteine methyltransferase